MTLNADARLTVKIAAQDLTGDTFTRTEGKISRLGSAAKAAAGFLAGAGVGTLAGALSDAARAAADDQASVERLAQAVENGNESFEAMSSIINERIKRGQALAFTDDQIRDSLARLVPMAHSTTEALELQAIALDLARGKNIDLSTASEIVGRVANGNTSILTRYGIVLKDGATATEALAALQEKFGGQAERYGSTTSAAIFRTKDAITEWKESIGATLGPSQELIALLPGLQSGASLAGGAFGAATPLIRDHAGALKSLGATAAKGGIVLGSLALVVEAVDQVGQTVKLVTDNWEKFTFALRTGRLDQIPVFGVFFTRARQVLDLLEAISSVWNTVAGAFGGGSRPSGPSVADFNRPNAPVTSPDLQDVIGGGGGGSFTPFAHGGIVDRPTVGLLGEAGPEAIVPLNRDGGWSPTINVYVSGNVTRSEQELAEVVAGEIVRRMRTAGQPIGSPTSIGSYY